MSCGLALLDTCQRRRTHEKEDNDDTEEGLSGPFRNLCRAAQSAGDDERFLTWCGLEFLALVSRHE